MASAMESSVFSSCSFVLFSRGVTSSAVMLSEVRFSIIGIGIDIGIGIGIGI